MTRMIERWFPCAEVSANAESGWGSGNAEKYVFPWFAARPTAQAKAAMLCSLLPWPDNVAEQERLKTLVQKAMGDRFGASREVRAELARYYPDGAAVLDPFSGRGMIPLEAARMGVAATGIDYSPVAVLASELLTDYPYRDWSHEPPLPWQTAAPQTTDIRLVEDLENVLAEIGRRWSAEMEEFYPILDGDRPWAYLWAVTLPCQECGHRFPLVGSYELRRAKSHAAKGQRAAWEDPGQSFRIRGDRSTGKFTVEVHDGPPTDQPTFVAGVDSNGKKIPGRLAICVHCGHVHALEVHKRLANEGLGEDALLVVASTGTKSGKSYRTPTAEDVAAADRARIALASESPFNPILPAIPDEQIPENNGATIRPQLYGARTYGDLMCARQTLSFVRLCRTIEKIGAELISDVQVSPAYARALTGYAAGVLARKLKSSTRGTTTHLSRDTVNHIFSNESTIAFSYDYLETGPYEGPGTWDSLAGSSLGRIRALFNKSNPSGTPTTVTHGSAVTTSLADQSMTAVVTDPPYDAMVYYSDLSDLYYVWIKRAIGKLNPELVVTTDARGIQEKTEEIIVKNHGRAPGDPRTEEHYDTMLTRAFAEMHRVVDQDGVVSIVFGSGDPLVWNRLLTVIADSGLVMTGSWPASTEAGGQQNKANIKTTLTMACRPAPATRPEGRKGAVEAQIRAEIASRYPGWKRDGLAPADMMMAAAGPAMEVVGRYSAVLDARGEPVPIEVFLTQSRSAMQSVMEVTIDHHPLETFDERTRFALWWVRLYGRQVQAKSALRWEVLASSLELADVRDLVPDRGQGVALVTSAKFKTTITAESAVIDVALALLAASGESLEPMGQVLADWHRNADDEYLWATIGFLANNLPVSDADAVAASRVLRARGKVGDIAESVAYRAETAKRKQRYDENQGTLL